jgi:hypothetical protein
MFDGGPSRRVGVSDAGRGGGRHDDDNAINAFLACVEHKMRMVGMMMRTVGRPRQNIVEVSHGLDGETWQRKVWLSIRMRAFLL